MAYTNTYLDGDGLVYVWEKVLAQTELAKAYTDSKVSALGSVLTYKGSCTYAELPTIAVEGDVWNVTDKHGNVPAGTNYAWSGSAWDALGGDVDLSGYQVKLTAGANVTISGSTISATNTTYTTASATSSGLMSAADKAKLDAVAAGANNYSLPTATASTLGGVKVGSNITNTSGTISLTKANVVAALGYTPGTSSSDTTYSDFTGATASSSGVHGLVPAPASGENGKFLKGDGTWASPEGKDYSDATASEHGLMSAADKAKLDGIAEEATKVTVDAALSSTSANPVQNKVVKVSLDSKQDAMSAITNSEIDSICA